MNKLTNLIQTTVVRDDGTARQDILALFIDDNERDAKLRRDTILQCFDNWVTDTEVAPHMIITVS